MENILIPSHVFLLFRVNEPVGVKVPSSEDKTNEKRSLPLCSVELFLLLRQKSSSDENQNNHRSALECR